MIDAHVSHALPKLTVAQMFADATPVVKIVLTGMLLTGLVAFVILLIGLVVGKGGRMASAARFLEAAMIATPIAALLGAALGAMNIFIGIANVNVANLAVAAPGIAEGILSLATGLLAMLLAVIAYGVVKPRKA